MIGSFDFAHSSLLKALIVIAITVGLQMIISRFINVFVRRLVRPERHETLEDEKKREDTIAAIARTGVLILLWIISVLVVLDTLGVNLAALATGAGVFGVIIGLGAQNTIKDILAGLFILVEHQYRVGDIVTLSGGTTGAMGTSGVVEEISLRITKLRDLDGTLNVVRNGEASIITNRTLRYSGIVIDVVVEFNTDVDKVEKIMNDIGLQMAGEEAFKGHTNQPIQFLRVDNFTASGATMRAVGQVAPATQWDIAGEYRRRLLKAFNQQGIVVALPQVLLNKRAQ